MSVWPSILTKIGSRAFLLLPLLFPAACQLQHNNPAARQNTVRFALASAVINLDPRYATDAASTRVIRLLYRSLVDFDEHNQAIPGCADWRKLRAKVYRFHIRDNCAVFTDGAVLTGDDVIATYQSILDKGSTSPFRQRLSVIKKMTKVEQKTVLFEIDNDDPLFPSYLDIGILPKSLLSRSHAFSQHPLGNGPFKLVRYNNNELWLERRNDHLLLKFLVIPDPTVRMLMLLRGEIDICQNDLSPELVKYAREQSQLTVQQANGSNFSYLGFNLKDPVLSDRRVRKAVALALNRDAIIRYVFYDAASKASSLLPPDHWVFDRRFTQFQYDPEQARRLLTQAGYTGKTLHLSYKTSKDPFRVRLATIIQAQLSEVGIALNIESHDWGTFFADIKAGKFQLYSLSWVGIRTPDIYNHVFDSQSLPPKGANRGRFGDAEIDRLLSRALSSPSIANKRLYYSEVQKRVIEQLPYVPLWYEDHIAIFNKKLAGYQINRSGDYDSLALVYWTKEG